MSEPGVSQPEVSQPLYTRDELVAELGISHAYAEKIWNAFGLPHGSGIDKPLDPDEVAALRLLVHSEHTMPEPVQVATARAIGQAMARLADWQADQLRQLEANPDLPWSMDEMAHALGQIQHHIWRRHLALALERDAGHEHGDQADVTVGFADIVGYTSLSRRIGFADLEEILDAFEERTHEIVVGLDGYVIKNLGDAVMFTFGDPRLAAMAAIGIHRLSESAPIPALRVGLARGPVLTRLGDVFGETVNIAARLCGSARQGKTLIDESVAAALRDDNRFFVKSIPTLSVRGYRRLHAYTLDVDRRAENVAIPEPGDDAETEIREALDRGVGA